MNQKFLGGDGLSQIYSFLTPLDIELPFLHSVSDLLSLVQVHTLLNLMGLPIIISKGDSLFWVKEVDLRLSFRPRQIKRLWVLPI